MERQAQDLTILAVDDEPTALELARVIAEAEGLGAGFLTAGSAAEAFGILKTRRVDLVLLDLGLGDSSGPELVGAVRAAAGEAPIAVVTADDHPDTIVQCMKEGAFDYATKPLSLSRFRAIAAHVREVMRLREEVVRLQRDEELPLGDPALARIVTRSPLMFELFRTIRRVARSPLAALVTGESGVGKELVARAIHELSCRKGAFVPVNAAGLDDSLLADTLFGHRRGAYTGAQLERRGLVKEAEGGTLFLDEIGDLGKDAQVKLLRFLQDGEYYPLGADRPEHSTARLVLATNADLQAKVASGGFRNDLYYRLMIHFLVIPPLRERREDIPLLVERFVEEGCRTLDRPPLRDLRAFLKAIEGWEFPGNVRELFALVHASLSASGERELSPAQALRLRSLQSLSPARGEGGGCGDFPAPQEQGEADFLPLEEMITRHIQEALRRCDGNQSCAARLLGISQSTISRRLSLAQQRSL